MKKNLYFIIMVEVNDGQHSSEIHTYLLRNQNNSCTSWFFPIKLILVLPNSVQYMIWFLSDYATLWCDEHTYQN